MNDKAPLPDSAASLRDLVIDMRADLRALTARIDASLETSKDHEDRLRYLERGFWKTSGAAAVVSAVVAFAAKHSPF